MSRLKAHVKTRLERERWAAGLSQTELARLANVMQSTVSKLENNKLPRVGVNVLASLAWALNKCGRNVDVTDLQPKRQRPRVRALARKAG